MLRLRLPPGYEALEVRIREAVAKRLARGSLAVNLNVKRSEGVDAASGSTRSALRQVLAALDKSARRRLETAPPRPRRCWASRGVLELVEAGGEAKPTCTRAPRRCWRASRQALDGMVPRARGGGRRAREVIVAGARSPPSSGWCGHVAALSARTFPDAIRQRLKGAGRRGCWRPVRRSMRCGSTRRRRMLATRADVEEELKRLAAHIAGARELLASSEPAGPAPGLPGPGVQPRGQHAVLEGQRCRDDAGRPRAEGRHRPDARAGAEH